MSKRITATSLIISRMDMLLISFHTISIIRTLDLMRLSKRHHQRNQPFSH